MYIKERLPKASYLSMYKYKNPEKSPGILRADSNTWNITVYYQNDVYTLFPIVTETGSVTNTIRKSGKNSGRYFGYYY